MYNCDSISEYLKDIRKYSLLDFEQEIELSKRIQDGDIAAHRTLIESNLRLVVNVARRYANNDCELMDIIQEGNLGLITAAQKYQSAFNVRFSTYACWWIQQSITRAMANKRRMIRLPFRKEELVTRLKKMSAELFQRFSRNPTHEELAKAMNITVEEITDIVRYSNSITSLDVEIDADESVCLKDLISDSTWDPEQMFMKKYTHECMEDILSTLKDNEREVIVKRYNLNNGERGMTLKAIGHESGVSAETIRQIEMRALRKLRANSSAIRESVYC